MSVTKPHEDYTNISYLVSTNVRGALLDGANAGRGFAIAASGAVG
jgi:hypothetical protein